MTTDVAAVIDHPRACAVPLELALPAGWEPVALDQLFSSGVAAAVPVMAVPGPPAVAETVAAFTCVAHLGTRLAGATLQAGVLVASGPAHRRPAPADAVTVAVVDLPVGRTVRAERLVGDDGDELATFEVQYVVAAEAAGAPRVLTFSVLAPTVEPELVAQFDTIVEALRWR